MMVRMALDISRLCVLLPVKFIRSAVVSDRVCYEKFDSLLLRLDLGVCIEALRAHPVAESEGVLPVGVLRLCVYVLCEVACIIRL